MSIYNTLDDLRSQLGHVPKSTVYAEKMLHRVPDAPVVDRAEFILAHCRDKRVLEFGASGPMHEKVKTTAVGYLGVDRQAGDRVVAFDLDDVNDALLPAFDPEIILCGEILEHLSNPGWFLTRLYRQFVGVSVVITTPNAFSDVGRAHIAKGTENVNVDHVSYYSYRTLRTLLNRAGYMNLTFGWYGGQPRLSEGIVVLANG